jgi:hypothetical protein
MGDVQIKPQVLLANLGDCVVDGYFDNLSYVHQLFIRPHRLFRNGRHLDDLL